MLPARPDGTGDVDVRLAEHMIAFVGVIVDQVIQVKNDPFSLKLPLC